MNRLAPGNLRRSCILDSTPQIPGTVFQSLIVELGFWIPIVTGIPDSLNCFPDSTNKISLDSRFQKSLTLGETSTLCAILGQNILTERGSLWSSKDTSEDMPMKQVTRNENPVSSFLFTYMHCMGALAVYSELQLDRSAKKERKKEKCETLLGGRGCGTYFPHSLNFKTRSYAYNVLKKKKKPCSLCRCRSFNSSLCRLSPFQLSFVAVSWPCHLSASVFCACAFFTYHRLRWIKLTKLF